MVRGFHLLQGVSGMRGLTSGFASGFDAQAARDRFLQAVARWRLVAVGAIKGEPPLQIANFRF